MTFRCRIATILALVFSALAFGADSPSYGPELQRFDYPYPVAQFNFTSQREALHMAYMDVRPALRHDLHTTRLL